MSKISSSLSDKHTVQGAFAFRGIEVYASNLSLLAGELQSPQNVTDFFRKLLSPSPSPTAHD